LFATKFLSLVPFSSISDRFFSILVSSRILEQHRGKGDMLQMISQIKLLLTQSKHISRKRPFGTQGGMMTTHLAHTDRLLFFNGEIGNLNEETLSDCEIKQWNVEPAFVKLRQDLQECPDGALGNNPFGRDIIDMDLWTSSVETPVVRTSDTNRADNATTWNVDELLNE
jgi:hypothetical protein